jgi:DNA-binding NarL/FixJ family response regulator
MDPNLTDQSDSRVERRRADRRGGGAKISTRRVTQVLVCGDHLLYRAALSSLVERDSSFRIAGESSYDIGEVARALAQLDIQMVILDYDVVPDSSHDIEMLERVLDCVAPRPTVVISSALDSGACQRALRHGVSGIVFKASGVHVLMAAIDSARRGQVWLDRVLLPRIFDDSHTLTADFGEKAKIDHLTPREREIMLVTFTGVTNKQIANKLLISEATVRHHLGSVFAKLGVSTRSELVVFGYRHRLATSVG